MPDLHRRARCWRAVVVDQADSELQRDAVAVFNEVAPFWLCIAVVRALVLFGPPLADGAGREHGCQLAADVAGAHVLYS